MRLIGLAVTLAVSLVLAPLAAGAQSAEKFYRIGWLSPASAAFNFDALRNGLGELGYVEGRNIVFQRRWADGAAARLPPLATELVRLKVDVICTAGTPIGAHRTNVQWRCGPRALILTRVGPARARAAGEGRRCERATPIGGPS